MKFKIAIDGSEHEIEVTRQGNRLRVQRDGQTVEVDLVEQDGATFALLDGHRRIPVVAHADGDDRELWVAGRQLRYRRVRRRGGGGDSRDGSLAATIPAVVSEVLVAVGDAVRAGDKLILLESMKMVIPIVAPRDGVVRAVNCAAGDAVQPGNPLVEFEE